MCICTKAFNASYNMNLIIILDIKQAERKEGKHSSMVG